jgi:large subunit ribosomal protein L29
MKSRDLRERSLDDLKELEKSLAKDVFTARFKNFTNRLDDTSSINKTKRDLARVKTLLREHALTGAIRAPSPDGAPAEKKPAAPKAKKKAAAAKPKAEAKTAAPKAKKAGAAAKKSEAK